MYCGASGDHNPIHVDIDFARKSRMPDVFAHGMLSAAYLGRLLTHWVPQQQVRSLSIRFTGITQLGHVPTCTGVITEKFEENGEKRVRLANPLRQPVRRRKARRRSRRRPGLNP